MITAKQIGNFFQEDIWTTDERLLSPAPRLALWTLRRLVITIKCFDQNNLPNFASALTYNCLLALVPILSIIFAIARGFGLGNEIEERMRENISAGSNPHTSEIVLNFVDRYIDHTHSGVFLGAGLLFLVFTVTNLSSSIESAFNTIWHVPTSRNIYRRVFDYTAIFFFFPLLIIVTSGFSVILSTVAGQYADFIVISGTMKFIMRYSPLLLAALAFTALFKYMPNTNVRWRHVLVPGLLAGILFQVLQFLYFKYQFELSSYNAIYGSFAALPLFMLWMQFSWYICLFCGQLCYASQHGDDYLFTHDIRNLSRANHDAVCLLLMRRICERFAEGGTPYSVQSLAQDTHLPETLVSGLVAEMTQAKLLCEIYNTEGTESCYQPATDLSRLTANHIIRQLDENGTGHLSYLWTKGNTEWQNILHLRRDACLKDGDKPMAGTEKP